VQSTGLDDFLLGKRRIVSVECQSVTLLVSGRGRSPRERTAQAQCCTVDATRSDPRDV